MEPETGRPGEAEIYGNPVKSYFQKFQRIVHDKPQGLFCVFLVTLRIAVFFYVLIRQIVMFKFPARALVIAKKKVHPVSKIGRHKSPVYFVVPVNPRAEKSRYDKGAEH